MSDHDIHPQDQAAARPTVTERTISPIAGRLGAGRAGKAIVVAALILGCGVFVAATWGDKKHVAKTEPEQPARQVVAFEPLQAALSGPTLANPGPGAPTLGATAASSTATTAAPGQPISQQPGAQQPSTGQEAPVTRAVIRSAPLIAYSRDGGGATSAGPAGPFVPAIEVPASAATELDQLRKSSTIAQARATRLSDRNFLIVAGAAIPCLLQTAMDTATPGYVSCLIPRDVLSDNGAVVLMEKGTKVLGEYRSSLHQGQSRLFVLWTRAVTPAGVAIRLDSPAADALGRAGFDGNLDTHFWERFGGALLLSIVDDGAFALAGAGATSNTARAPSDAAAVALQNSINIPPSLRKAQGSEVSIFVAQDFDFSGVYGLKAR